MTPVFTVIVSGSSVTETVVAGAMGFPGSRRNGAAAPAPAGIA